MAEAMTNPATSLSAVSGVNTLLAVRDHAPSELAEAQQEAAELQQRLRAVRKRIHRLEDLLEAAKDD